MLSLENNFLICFGCDLLYYSYENTFCLNIRVIKNTAKYTKTENKTFL